MTSGYVKSMYQYPIKSFKGYQINKAKVERYGIYGDRAYAFKDNTKQRKHLSGKQAPEIMGYSAFYVKEQSDEMQFPKVKITTPTGKVFDWGDEEFIHEMKAISNHDITPIAFNRKDEQMAFDLEKISIISESSLRKLEKQWGKDITAERFRPNLVLSVDPDIPFIENNWIGKTLTIGEVELQIISRIKRCMMINVDPNHLKVDPTLLKMITNINDGDFGVYASILKTGTIRLNDRYDLLD